MAEPSHGKRAADEGRRLAQYVEQLQAALGHADRREPLRAYLTGLLLPGERKSVEPMAARIDPRRVQARHQSMHHFVATAPWDATAILAVARDYALGALERHGPVGAWVVDDTAFPKKGTHSVGVARQYCSVVGKQDNCQVAVTVSAVNATLSVPSAYQSYLPAAWARDRARRQATGVPRAVRFQRKWEIALMALRGLLAEDLPRAPVVADAGYGTITAFREGVTALGLSYAVGITGDTSVWPPGTAPRRPKRWRGQGRRRPDIGARPRIGPRPCTLSRARSHPRRGAPSGGVKARAAPCSPALRPSRSAPPIAIIAAPHPGRRSGSSSNGPAGFLHPRSTGCPQSPRPSRSGSWSVSLNSAGGSSATTKS